MTTTTHATLTSAAGTARRRTPWLVAVGAAVAVAATGIVVATDDAEPDARPAARTDAEQYSAALVTLAEIARAQGLTGLSPLSLAPIDDGIRGDARRAAVERELADLAIAEGLTGLSPVSLRPIDD